VHDDALRRLAAAAGPEFIIGSTDHAADHILPPIVLALGQLSPAPIVKFRFDRTTPLNEAFDRGSVDLAVFITEASSRTGILVGSRPLVWCTAPSWTPPPPRGPWPLIAIEAPCAIRGRALAVPGEHGIPTKVVGEAAYLAGVINARRSSRSRRAGCTPRWRRGRRRTGRSNGSFLRRDLDWTILLQRNGPGRLSARRPIVSGGRRWRPAGG
jgi:DNA-binding transcriptional LysR family regulator